MYYKIQLFKGAVVAVIVC